jgi:hypothetical protein
MIKARTLTLVCAAALLAACGTTKEAEKSMAAQYLGKPVDSFFARHGAPQSSYKLSDGGTVYDWVGGRTTIDVAPVYRTITPVAAPAMGTGETKTTTHTSNPSPGTTVTTSRTTGYSFSVGVPTAMQVMVTPAQQIQVFCEAQITTNAQGIITHIHASQDTRGAEMKLSRCAEVFGVN